jgi:hypothetical protein
VSSQTIETPTDQLPGAGANLEPSPALTAGPHWNAFEEFRKAGSSGLEKIAPHSVGALNCKAGSFKILHDADFQWLLGLSSEVGRLQKGLKVVVQAAKIALDHPDADHIGLFISAASMLAELPELPRVEGHRSFQLTKEEQESAERDDFDPATAVVPRPTW